MSRPTTLPEPWRSLAAKLGGVGPLADALGVPPRTLRRWAQGERHASRTAQMTIDALFQSHHLEPPC
jgi:hypothetical protein